MFWEISPYKSGDFLLLTPSSYRAVFAQASDYQRLLIFSFSRFFSYTLTNMTSEISHKDHVFFFFFGKKEDLSDCSSIRRYICIYRVTKSNLKARS